ncbi:uncharacterized protein LOC102722738 [Oryza brachyantha]|uniref:Uncharacterized protein n=1 Tax=Oryza brachyantha TaxID=4533 RepID=J3LAE5_ORYBR|nr:uncharacterized protein LOC102722738 [Oryza brachyantha]
MQQLNCVSLLLLLLFMVAALISCVATAHHRELPMSRTAANERGDHEQDQNLVSSRPVASTKFAADHEEEEAAAAMRRCKQGRKSCKNFRTRKLPADGRNHFYGHMPFTADYHSVRRHPPSHN